MKKISLWSSAPHPLTPHPRAPSRIKGSGGGQMFEVRGDLWQVKMSAKDVAGECMSNSAQQQQHLTNNSKE